MNIYILMEIKSRELLSKLLLAFETAKKNNHVFIGRLQSYLDRNFFKPGIVHMKSITPGSERMDQLRRFKSKDFLVTSLDEENGFIDTDLNFINYRFSNNSISLTSKIFSYGNYDYISLKKKYPKFKNKFIKSGNPRIDFWRDDFKNFYKKISYIPYDNYILFSSNFEIFSHNSLKKNVNYYKKSG